MKVVSKLVDAFNSLTRVLCYKYEDLDPDEMRLLEVLPGKGTEVLRCRVIRAGLKNPPIFNALSYTWDNSPVRKTRQVVLAETIFLNDRSCLITPNLLSALRFYRENYSDPLWVDYLCINQSNLQERGRQVLNMRRIYEQCQKVFVWLGREANDSTLAIEFLGTIYDEASKTASADFIVRSILSGNFVREWKALNHFWKRPYWMRTWVIQEQAVSKRIEAACGPQRLNWKVLYWFTSAITKAISLGLLDSCLPKVREQGFKLKVKVIHHLLNLQKLRTETARGKRLHLLSVLDSTRRALASDDRDKIYGILSFVQDETTLVPRPDYTCPVQKVYQSLVLAYIDKYQNLDIIVQASASKKLPGLPSWTPDWSDEKRISRLNRRHSHVGLFHAAGDSTASIIPSPVEEILICEGFSIDTVDTTGYCLLDTSENPERSQSENATSIYADDEAIFSAIWRTLLGSVRYFSTSAFGKAPEVMGQVFLQKCRDYENVFLNKDHPQYDPNKDIHPNISIFELWYHKNRSLKIAGRSISEWASERLESAWADEENIILNASFERTMKKKLYGRKLITTEKGYISLAPQAADSGDKVCVLFGCSTPVILRSLAADKFRFIGECYVHGIMEGEAMAMLEKEEVLKEKFALQ